MDTISRMATVYPMSLHLLAIAKLHFIQQYANYVKIILWLDTTIHATICQTSLAMYKIACIVICLIIALNALMDINWALMAHASLLNVKFLPARPAGM